MPWRWRQHVTPNGWYGTTWRHARETSLQTFRVLLSLMSGYCGTVPAMGDLRVQKVTRKQPVLGMCLRNSFGQFWHPLRHLHVTASCRAVCKVRMTSHFSKEVHWRWSNTDHSYGGHMKWAAHVAHTRVWEMFNQKTEGKISLVRLSRTLEVNINMDVKCDIGVFNWIRVVQNRERGGLWWRRK